MQAVTCTMYINIKSVLWIDPRIYGELVLKLSQENNEIFTQFDCHMSNNWWQITTFVVKWTNIKDQPVAVHDYHFVLAFINAMGLAHAVDYWILIWILYFLQNSNSYFAANCLDVLSCNMQALFSDCSIISMHWFLECKHLLLLPTLPLFS